MPQQPTNTNSTSSVCTPLFNTIRALSDLDSQEKRLVLLKQMQSALKIADLPMSDAEISAIIAYLNDLVQKDSLDLNLLTSNQFLGVLLDKRATGLERTIALVFDPKSQEYELIILTGRKFSNPVSLVTSKYANDDSIAQNSNNDNSLAKKSLYLEFRGNKFEVNVKKCIKKQCKVSLGQATQQKT